MGSGQRAWRRGSGRVTAFALAACLGACSGEGDFDARFGGEARESQHYRYRYQADDPMACAGVLASLEDYGGMVAELLGVREDERTLTSYYKYPSRTEFTAAKVCRSTASACTDSTDVFAPVPLAGHELVHNVMAKRTGTDISLLLAEGLANALTCAPHSKPRDLTWDFRQFNSRPDEHDVAQAGRLVLGLLRHISPPELLSLIDATTRDDDPARVRELLLERHGVDLDEVQRELEIDGTGSCVPLYACAGQPLPVGKSSLGYDCRGPRPASLPLEHSALSVRVMDARVRFMPCSWSQPTSPLAGLWPWYAIGNVYYWLEQPRAPHALWLDGAEGYETPLETDIDLAPLSGVFAEQCRLDQAQPMSLTAQVAIVLDGRAPIAHFPLAFSEPAQLVVSWQTSTDPDLMRAPSRPVSVSYCRACAGDVATDCAALKNLEQFPRVDVAEAGVLVVRPSAPLARAAVLNLSLRRPSQ